MPYDFVVVFWSLALTTDLADVVRYIVFARLPIF